MNEAPAGIETTVHRRPNRNVPGFDAALVKILTNVLRAAAGGVTRLLGYTPGTADTYRVGMPEALLYALMECGDREAARLACESFLERDDRDRRAVPAAFGEYRAYFIEERREEGGGWYVLEKQGGANVMPGGEWFASTEAACLVIDLLYEHGLMADEDFIEDARKHAFSPR